MARRMVERGVRFIQLYSGGNKGGAVGWDAHSQCDANHTLMARRVDKPIAGLLADLKSRGLLEDTLVVWGGDFGRTPFTNGGNGNGAGTYSMGRDHNPYGFTVWMAGGGIKGGKAIGATDEIGLHAAEDKVHVHDLHATMLRLLGLEHEKLTYFFQGRDFRLTDVGGQNNLASRLTAG
jgi:arylsulfatase A-like enzyme